MIVATADSSPCLAFCFEILTFLGEVSGFAFMMLWKISSSACGVAKIEVFSFLLLGKDLVDESEEYSTLSGYILFHLGRLPENGETVEADGYLFEVVTMDGHKIEKVRIIAKEKPERD